MPDQAVREITSSLEKLEQDNTTTDNLALAKANIHSYEKAVEEANNALTEFEAKIV